MFRVELIGNLGADVERKETNGKVFYTFRVAHTDRYTDTTSGEVREKTTWANCLASSISDNLLPILRKGQKVFVRGRADLRVFSSEKYRTMMAGLDVSVTEIELCGISREEREYIENARAIFAGLEAKGYATTDEIPAKNVKPSKK